MSYYILLSLALLAYLIGSIPTSIWIGKWFYSIDVRQHGSGNMGATNTFRVLGRNAGIPVLVLDIFKGWFAVKLCRISIGMGLIHHDYLWVEMVLGVTAVAGHVFPVFAKFRGGKGVATLLGASIAILAWPAIICIGVFLVTLVLTNYVSLGSIMAALIFPPIVIFIFVFPFPPVL